MGVETDLYRRNLIAYAFSFSSFRRCSSVLNFGFNTGFSESGGNIHAGCGLSGAFFFFFVFRGGSGTFRPISYSGLISGGGFLIFFLLPMTAVRIVDLKTKYQKFQSTKYSSVREYPELVSSKPWQWH